MGKVETVTCGLFFYEAGAGQDPPPQIKTAGTDPLPIPAAWYLRSLAGVALLAPHLLGDPLDEGDLCPLLLFGQLVADFAACKAALG